MLQLLGRFFSTQKSKDQYSIIDEEMNWRENVSIKDSPDEFLSGCFLQHSSMLSLQLSFFDWLFVADHSTK